MSSEYSEFPAILMGAGLKQNSASNSSVLAVYSGKFRYGVTLVGQFIFDIITKLRHWVGHFSNVERV